MTDHRQLLPRPRSVSDAIAYLLVVVLVLSGLVTTLGGVVVLVYLAP